MDDVCGGEEADVKEGGEEGVVDEGVVGGDGVFIDAEVLEAGGDEVLEPLLGGGVGEGVAEVVGGAGVLGEFFFDLFAGGF